MNELDKALADVTRGLADLTRQVGPEAAEATLRAIQLSGVAILVTSVVGLLLCVVLFAVGMRVFKHGVKLKEKDTDRSSYSAFDNGSDARMIGTGVMIVSGGCAALTFIAGICNIAAWVSAVNPAAGLAYRLLEKL